jgi:hypothetical protein
MTTLPIFATLEPLETTGLFTPLGIRFWDTANDRAVVDGLEVTARPLGSRGRGQSAFQTTSGVYAFRALVGMRSVETLDPALPPGVHPIESSPPLAAPFVIEVQDRRGRFLPVNFQVDLPYRGVYPTRANGSPPGTPMPGFFLFSTPSRPALSGLATVRAQVVERVGVEQFRPAQMAVLEVDVDAETTWVGIADVKGSVAVHFPYPPFADRVGPVSPPPGPPESRLQGWDLAVRVRYQLAAQTKPDEWASWPDLGRLLTQSLADFWLTQLGPPQTTSVARLTFGQPLLLQTAGRSELWIQP